MEEDTTVAIADVKEYAAGNFCKTLLIITIVCTNEWHVIEHAHQLQNGSTLINLKLEQYKRSNLTLTDHATPSKQKSSLVSRNQPGGIFLSLTRPQS